MAIQVVSVGRPGCGLMTNENYICRDCGHAGTSPPISSCPTCRSARIIQHAELMRLSIAHVDCDAFYASVEKRDNPELHNKPVIVGGGKRGVVAAACYVARIHGVRSAMPMFKALSLCPDAVVISPRMDTYRDAGLKIRQLMLELTPLVEPLSIDEAFLDLSGTERLHGQSPAASLIALAKQVEKDVGVSVSIGLAANKSMAKIASDQDKPRGFHVIGATEAAEWLAPRPVSLLYGAGRTLVQRLKARGIETCGELARADVRLILEEAGEHGPSLQQRALGIDLRKVTPDSPPKSISSETTFEDDLSDGNILTAWIEMLAEKVSARLKKKAISGRRVVLKLKTHDFRTITRSTTLMTPTQMADQIFEAGKFLLSREVSPDKKWRLIGIGVEMLDDHLAGEVTDLADPDLSRRVRLEEAMDTVRKRHGDSKIIRGRRLAIDKKQN